MEEMKVFCRKAEELGSIDELNLSSDIVRLINSSDVSTEEIIAWVRWFDMGNDFDAQYFWVSCLDGGRSSLDFSKDEWDELANGGYGFDYLLEIRKSLDKAGFLSEGIRNLGYIARRYLDADSYHEWRDMWLGGDEVEVSDDFREFNKNYESFDCQYEKKLKRILEIFKDGLTRNQYDMAKFDLTHPGLPICCCKSGGFVWYYPVESKELFVLGDEDYFNLESARYNSQGFFKDEIMDIILS